MELYDIVSAVAAYFDDKVPDDFVKNNIDLALLAINQVRLQAELDNDFNFTRKLLELEVDGVTGGSLDDATVYGETNPCPVEIKTVVDVGQFDTDGNLIPVEWTTVADSLNRQRQDNPRTIVRYPTDGEAVCGPFGQRRFTFSGNRVYSFQKAVNTTFTLGIEAYTFTKEWPDNDTTPADDNSKAWLSKGHQYLLWAAVVHCNHLYKHFVFRQEGNLPPPEKLAEAGLAAFMRWDVLKYEQFRRHSR